jgi:glycine betaine/choline ABC-type transport system substrate-binding protein
MEYLCKTSNTFWADESEDVMKKLLSMVIVTLMLFVGAESDSCVGKILYIGIPNAPAEQILAELVATLVTERTGTTVKIVPFKEMRDVYAAVKKGEVGLVIENRDRAFEILGKPREANAKNAQEIVRREYQKNLNMVWLEPIGGTPPYSPVISTETLTSLPALPKLLNKLSGVLTDDSYSKLVKAAKNDSKPKKSAREFLKAKRLI